MLPIEFLFQENIDASLSLATDRYFLNSFQKSARSRVAVLRVHSAKGDGVSVGRFHRVDAKGDAPASGPRIARRLTGGRAVPFGEGFVAVSLLLPHRSALVSDDPWTLSPVQIPNRYVRGVLTALRGLGVEAFYPGRDFITVNRKAIGMVTFETDERGALLFEAVIAVERDFSALPGEPVDRRAATSLRAETGERLRPRDVAEALQIGFGEHFRAETTARELSPLEEQAIAAIETREFRQGWLECRTPRPDLDRSAVVAVPLGALEVAFALEQDRFLREIQFSGDFIANSAGVEALERELKLCPADWRSIAIIADQIYNRPENFILGIGRLRTIPDAIVRALPS